MNIETPAEKRSKYPLIVGAIALVALLGFLYACFHSSTEKPRPLLTPEEFEAKMDEVTLNIPELLNESEGSLLSRCIFSLKETRIQVPYHRRKRFIAVTPEEEAILGQDSVRQMEAMDH